ncbi:MAG: hypothetical protein R2708_05245 [Vicinamibacterales bacterium]
MKAIAKACWLALVRSVKVSMVLAARLISLTTSDLPVYQRVAHRGTGW